MKQKDIKVRYTSADQVETVIKNWLEKGYQLFAHNYVKFLLVNEITEKHCLTFVKYEDE